MSNLHPIIANWYHTCPKCQQTLNKEERVVNCLACGFYFYVNPAPCVAAVIANGDQVLLGKRAFEPKKGLWNLPGGFVEIGETVEDAVHREVKEEMGASVTIICSLGQPVPDIYSDFHDHTLNFIYLVKLIGEEYTAQDDVAELQWMSINDIQEDQLAFLNDKEGIKRYQAYMKEHHE